MVLEYLMLCLWFGNLQFLLVEENYTNLSVMSLNVDTNIAFNRWFIDYNPFIYTGTDENEGEYSNIVNKRNKEVRSKN